MLKIDKKKNAEKKYKKHIDKICELTTAFLQETAYFPKKKSQF